MEINFSISNFQNNFTVNSIFNYIFIITFRDKSNLGSLASKRFMYTSRNSSQSNNALCFFFEKDQH